jgi:amino acid permease
MYLGEAETDAKEPLVASQEDHVKLEGCLKYPSDTEACNDDDDDDDDDSDKLKLSETSSSASTATPSNSAYLSMFLLLNTMIGSGILNQPFVFMQSGMVGALVMYLLATISTWYGLLLLTEAGMYVRVFEFADLARKAFGEKGDTLVDVNILLMTIGTELGYIIVVGETTTSLLDGWGCTWQVCDQFWVTIITVIFFITPICLLRHYGHLAGLSIFSVLAIVLCLLLVAIGGPIENRKSIGNDITVINWLGMLSSFGSIVQSLQCSSANFQAYISTKPKSRNIETWSWVTGGAVLMGAGMLVTMGMMGYLVFGADTDGEILNNFPGVKYDFFKAMVVAHLICYTPVNFILLRYSFVKLFFNMKSEELPIISHVTLSLSLIAFLTGSVLLLNEFGVANGVGFSITLNLTGPLPHYIYLLHVYHRPSSYS